MTAYLSKGKVRALRNIYQHSTINNKHGDLTELINLRLSRSVGSSEGDGSCVVTKILTQTTDNVLQGIRQLQRIDVGLSQ